MSTSQPPTRRTVSSVRRYEDAEHAVDYLSDHDFPVDHVSIVARASATSSRCPGA